ncbi:MAG: hypothetical protein ACP5OG_02900 [Candidatus Nanoarchaeia archaeon]
MFKKKCTRCSNKVEKKFDYCPYCGNSFANESDKEDYGVLGKNDFDNLANNPEIGAGFMDKLLASAMNNAVKMLEKQMKSIAQEQNNAPREQATPFNNVDMQFYINGKRVDFPGINKRQVRAPVIKRIKPNQISDEQAHKLSKLPKKTPDSKVRRLSGRLIYELAVPGVNNIEDVLINRLENSIEVKALSENEVYSKTININLPLLGYKLEKDNLILELQAK